MKETIEIGPHRFNENLEWLLHEWGGSKAKLGRLVFSYTSKLSLENGRKRICRLLNGQVDLKVCDVEAMAVIFGVPPAVLLYGTEEQLEKSFDAAWRNPEVVNKWEAQVGQ